MPRSLQAQAIICAAFMHVKPKSQTLCLSMEAYIEVSLGLT